MAFKDYMIKTKKELGLNMKEFAALVGVSKQTMEDWLVGYGMPKLSLTREVRVMLNKMLLDRDSGTIALIEADVLADTVQEADVLAVTVQDDDTALLDS